MKKLPYIKPFEVAELLVEHNHPLLKKYPDIAFDYEQQGKLATELVRSGQVKQVIMVTRTFTAVKGIHFFDHEVADLDLVQCPADFYATHSDDFDENTKHQHLDDAKGNSLTVIDYKDIHRLPWRAHEGAEYEEDVKVGYLGCNSVEVRKLWLFRPDVNRLFGAIVTANRLSPLGNKIESKSPETPSLNSLLNILQDKTGASSHAEAVELGITKVEHAQLDELYQENSDAYAALKMEMRKAENEGLKTKTMTEMEGLFRQYDGLKSRQPKVLAQMLFDIFPS